ncbi:hypothetical protein [Methylorubrum zatmanii]
MQPRSLDEARRLYPTLGFALYAYTPGGAVTLEVHDAGQVFAWTAETEARAWEVAFPIDEPPPEIDELAAAHSASPAVSDPSQDADFVELPEIEADEPAPSAPPSVFD